MVILPIPYYGFMSTEDNLIADCAVMSVYNFCSYCHCVMHVVGPKAAAALHQKASCSLITAFSRLC